MLAAAAAATTANSLVSLARCYCFFLRRDKVYLNPSKACS